MPVAQTLSLSKLVSYRKSKNCHAFLNEKKTKQDSLDGRDNTTTLH